MWKEKSLSLPRFEHRSSGPNPATRLMERSRIHLLQNSNNLFDLWLDEKMPSFNTCAIESTFTDATSIIALHTKNVVSH
jgi:hypothetical protein